MAKNLTIGGKSVTTDEDWYEINAFGKRTGARYLNGQASGGGAPKGGPTTPAAGSAATRSFGPPPSTSPVETQGGVGSGSASLDGIAALGGGSSGGLNMPTPGALKALGNRLYPQDMGPLAGRKIY
jgi:hypothetical protein